MRKGFSYTIEDDKMRDHMALSAEDKLQWLAEVNEFLELALGPREKEFRERLRRCEL
jgi:hypothetical protein